MKVFISYSMKDTEQVKVVSDQIRPLVEEVHWWNESKTYGDVAWESIGRWIDEADIVVAIITDKVVSRAMSVGQELGRAVEKGKKIIPIVEHSVSSTELGFLSNVTYIRFDKEHPEAALDAIKLAIEQEKQSRAIKTAICSIPGSVQRHNVQTTSNEGSALPGVLLGAAIVTGLYLIFKE